MLSKQHLSHFTVKPVLSSTCNATVLNIICIEPYSYCLYNSLSGSSLSCKINFLSWLKPADVREDSFLFFQSIHKHCYFCVRTMEAARLKTVR